VEPCHLHRATQAAAFSRRGEAWHGHREGTPLRVPFSFSLRHHSRSPARCFTSRPTSALLLGVVYAPRCCPTPAYGVTLPTEKNDVDVISLLGIQHPR
jgi:hypothetical protein